MATNVQDWLTRVYRAAQTFKGNITMGAGAQAILDSGTATAAAGAATLSKQSGVITSEALTTAAAADYTLTITNTFVAATSKVFVSVANGTNTTLAVAARLVTPGAGSVVIKIINNHASVALNGTLKVSFVVFN